MMPPFLVLLSWHPGALDNKERSFTITGIGFMTIFKTPFLLSLSSGIR